MINRRVADFLPVIIVVLLIVAWQIAIVSLKIPQYAIPAPSAVLTAITRADLNWFLNSWKTLYETVIGFLVSIAISIPLAIMISYSVLLRRAFYPLILAVQVLPKAALAPILFLALGFTDLPRILTVFLLSFFPIVIGTTAGLEALDPDYVDLLRSLGFSKFKIYLEARIPNSLPYLFTGLKVGVTLSVLGAVVAEFVVSNVGLGFLLLSSLTNVNTPVAFGALTILMVMGGGLYLLVLGMERIAIPWYFRSKKSSV